MTSDAENRKAALKAAWRNIGQSADGQLILADLLDIAGVLKKDCSGPVINPPTEENLKYNSGLRQLALYAFQQAGTPAAAILKLLGEQEE